MTADSKRAAPAAPGAIDRGNRAMGTFDCRF
jgi:hypothetical protein